MDVAEIIKAAREKKKLTKSELARLCGVTRQTVGDWESGRSAPNRNRAPTVAKILSIPLRLISSDPTQSNVAFLGEQASNERTVPLISWVQAGLGVQNMDQAGAEFLAISFAVSDATFALEVRGDSMEPLFREGDVIVVDPGVGPSADDYVVAELLSKGQRQGDGDTTLKQYRPRGFLDGAPIFDLVPLNPRYETVTVSRSRPGRIIGTVVEHRRRFRR